MTTDSLDCFDWRNERRDFIKAKYEQHKFAIITCADRSDLMSDFKQAMQLNDLMALLQVYAEGIDLSTPLPDMVISFTDVSFF